MIRNYEKCFLEKIKMLENHKKYNELKAKADESIKSHTGYGLEAIIAGDFMDRIIAMPIDRIVGWLDGKNYLNWQDGDREKFYELRKNGFKSQEAQNG